MSAASAASVASAALSDDDLGDNDAVAADVSTLECNSLQFTTAAHRNRRNGGSSAECSTGIQLDKFDHRRDGSALTPSSASVVIDLSSLTLREPHGDGGPGAI